MPGSHLLTYAVHILELLRGEERGKEGKERRKGRKGRKGRREGRKGRREGRKRRKGRREGRREGRKGRREERQEREQDEEGRRVNKYMICFGMVPRLCLCCYRCTGGVPPQWQPGAQRNTW